MDDIANIDQALRLIWEKVVKEQPDSFNVDDAVIEAMRRAYNLREAQSDLVAMGWGGDATTGVRPITDLRTGEIVGWAEDNSGVGGGGATRGYTASVGSVAESNRHTVDWTYTPTGEGPLYGGGNGGNNE